MCWKGVYVIGFNVPAIMRLLKPGEQAPGRGGPGGAVAGPGLAIYQRDCQVCHGTGREGTPTGPSLVGLIPRLTVADVRTTVVEGRNRMPAFHQLSAADVDAVVAYLSAADGLRGRGAAFGRGGAGAAPSFPPGPVVQRGPSVARQVEPGGGRGAGPQAYPEGAEAPADRLTMEGYGLYPTLINPPYTTLTAYDLNKGAIKWQIGFGDDLRLAAQGIKGTGSADLTKGSIVPTASGLLFANAPDQKIHVYDSETGKQISEIPLGAATSGSSSMYEAGGRQYLLVTASESGGRGGPGGGPAGVPAVGPKGLIAFTVK